MADAYPFAKPEPGVRYRRPWTEPHRDPATGKTSVTTKRVCNGCQRLIGDGTVEEVDHVMAGGDWPDARAECPWCTPEPDDAHDVLLVAARVAAFAARGDSRVMTTECAEHGRIWAGAVLCPHDVSQEWDRVATAHAADWGGRCGAMLTIKLLDPVSMEPAVGDLARRGQWIGGVVTDAGGGSVRVLIDRDTPEYPSRNDRVFIVIRENP